MVHRTTLNRLAAAARPRRARVNSLESCEVSFSQGFSPFASSSQVPGPTQEPRGPGYLGRPPQLSPARGPPNRPLKESVQAYRLRHLSCQGPPFCRRFWRRSSLDSFGSSGSTLTAAFSVSLSVLDILQILSTMITKVQHCWTFGNYRNKNVSMSHSF